MDAGARIVLAVGLGALLVADIGCSKSRADIETIDTGATEIAYQNAEAAHKSETEALGRIYQERYDLLAEYRHELDDLYLEERKWVEAEKLEIEDARKQGDAAYQERWELAIEHYHAHCDESRKKLDAITATYIPRVKQVNDRIDAQSNHVATARVSLDGAKVQR